MAFQECLSQDAAVRVEMERRVKLRTLCETRWASRADSLYGKALESLEEDGDVKARGYVSSILHVRFNNCVMCNSRAIHRAPRKVNLSTSWRQPRSQR